VFAWERIPLDEKGKVAKISEAQPDWQIESLSPDQSQTKVTGNILYCLKQGIRLDWLTDPYEGSVLVYSLRRQPELLQVAEDLPPVADLLALRLTRGDLFGWLKLEA